MTDFSERMSKKDMPVESNDLSNKSEIDFSQRINDSDKHKKKSFWETTSPSDEKLGEAAVTAFQHGLAGIERGLKRPLEEIKKVGKFLLPNENIGDMPEDRLPEKFGIGEPKTSVDRIAKTTGEYGALGGLGGASSAIGGAVSGAAYQTLVEDGMHPMLALGVSILSLKSPGSAADIIKKYKSGGYITPKELEKIKAAQQKGISKDKATHISELLPEEAKLGTQAENIEPNYELSREIRTAVSPLELERKKSIESKNPIESVPQKNPITPKTIDYVFTPVSQELNQIAPSNEREVRPNRLGRMAQSLIQRQANLDWRSLKPLWQDAEHLANITHEIRPELADRLQEIIIQSPVHAQGGESRLETFANTFYRNMVDGHGQLLPVSNRDIYKSIQQARVNLKNDIQGGQNSDRIREYMNVLEDELIRSSGTQERAALLRARAESAKWYNTYKHKDVLPFRNRQSTHQDLAKKHMDPDTFRQLSPILSRSPMGQQLNRQISRNLLENAIEPHLLNPRNITEKGLATDLNKLEGIVPDQILQSIMNKAFNAHTNALESEESARHQKLLNEYNRKHNKPIIYQPSKFSTITESGMSLLNNMEGLMELRSELEKVGNLDLYKKVARNKGFELLFGGQMDIPQRSDRVRRMLNDKDFVPYLKETLGVENFEILKNIAKDNMLEKRFKEAEKHGVIKSLETFKTALEATKAVKNILTGHFVSGGSQAVNVAKKVFKKGKPVPEESRKNLELQ